jgi:hypothetical protein
MSDERFVLLFIGAGSALFAVSVGAFRLVI